MNCQPTQTRAWYVIRTRVAKEQAASEEIRRMGYEVYAPSVRMEKIHHRTKKKLIKTFPMFTRYLFVRIPATEAAWGSVQAIREVDCFLGNEGLPTRVREAEIAAMRLAEDRGDFDATKPENRRLQPGDKIEIDGTAFHGFYGTITNNKGKQAVRAVVSIIGRLTEVSVPWENVRPA